MSTYAFSGLDASYFVGCSTLGNAKYHVSQVAGLGQADENCLTFYSGLDVERAAQIEVGILLVDERLKTELKEAKSHCLVFCAAPKYRFLQCLDAFFSDSFGEQLASYPPTYASSAYVEEGALIGEGTRIFPQAVVLAPTQMGSNCIVQANTVLGNNGLGDVWYEGAYHRFVHLGGLQIGDKVHIGSQVTINRGMLEDTIIGSGTRIANNVNIGHSVVIEEDCYIASGVSMAGACIIRKNSWLGPGATLTDHVEVGEGSMLGAGAVLLKDALPHSLYLGNPARKIKNRTPV